MGRKVVDNCRLIGARRYGRLRVATIETVHPLMHAAKSGRAQSQAALRKLTLAHRTKAVYALALPQQNDVPVADVLLRRYATESPSPRIARVGIGRKGLSLL
jgi:hypothetical protein